MALIDKIIHNPNCDKVIGDCEVHADDPTCECDDVDEIGLHFEPFE